MTSKILLIRPVLWLFRLTCSGFLQGPGPITRQPGGGLLTLDGIFVTKTMIHLIHSDEEEGEDEEPNDDDVHEQSAYGRKSLGWTRKFRKLFPYETARRSVMDLGLRSKEEWDEYVSDGKPQHGPYLPNNPDEMYVEEWESWGEFLGLIRPYNETRSIVRDVLRLRDMVEYEEFVDSNRQRAEGLRIPAKPREFYKNNGWATDEHFFGQDE
jgi:hypothetical protein